MNITINVPTTSIREQLASYLRTGLTPESATDEVLAPYGDAPLAVLARPLVRDLAGKVERDIARRTEVTALAPLDLTGLSKAGATRALRAKQRAQERLPETRFRVPGPGKDGAWTLVNWGEATIEVHRARISWFRTQVQDLEGTINRHSRAIQLIEDHPGATCLNDIPNWVALLDEGTTDASAPVVTPAPASDRKPRTRKVTGAEGGKAA